MPQARDVARMMLPSWRHAVLLCLCAACIPARGWARSSGAEPVSGPPATESKSAARGEVHLVVDYLPPLIDLHSEALTVVGRLLNETSRDVKVVVRYRQQTLAKVKQVRHTLPAGKTLRLEHAFEPGVWREAEVAVSVDGDARPPVRIEALNPNQPLPDDLRSERGHLRRGDRYVVLRVERMTGKTRRWEVARTLYRSVASGDLPSSVRLVGHPLAGAQGEGKPVGLFAGPLSKRLQHYGARVQANQIIWGETSQGYPVLDLLCRTGRALARDATEAECAVVILPPDDPRLATPRRLYRMAVEALLDRLRLAGVSSILVVGPACPGLPEDQVASYVEAAQKAARRRRVWFLDLSAALSKEHWRRGQQGWVLGRFPNAAGLDAAAAAIVAELQCH